jgi:hypothetical protein
MIFLDQYPGRARSALALALGLLSFGSPSAAEPNQPTVVELFTSQGCSSCPPANANLVLLSDRPGILALSFGVTYWDQLGWKDTFAKPEFTDRQVTYETPLKHTGPFTPQIVVDGRSDVVGNRLPAIEALIAASPRKDEPTLSLAESGVSIGAGDAPAPGADVWLVSYDPALVQVPVKRGENDGRTLPHKNVVHELTKIGIWTGTALSIAFSAPKAGLRSAVLIQAPNGGPIIAAAAH